MSDRIVIVGGGQAGAQAAASLRAGGFEGAVTMLAQEPVAPYQRPPLSKQYMAGETAFDRVRVKPEAFYREHGIDVLCGNAVQAIERARKAVTLADGRRLTYARLLLATGSRPRPLDVPGADLPGVHYLRTLADAAALRERLRPGTRLVVAGGGYIGLEVAAVAAGLGLEVTVVEARERVLSRVVGPVTSRFFQRMHAEEGVRILTSTALARLEGRDGVEGLVCHDGARLPAHAVLAGVGIVPNTGLAREAGLDTDDGILVDEHARTGDPHIWAAGDCARFPSARYGRRIRLECVQNANEQARAAAATLLGQDKRYDPVPWFWSEQYDVRLQIAGLADGHDRAVVRGNPDAGRSFAVFYLRRGVPIAVEAVNRTAEYIAGRKLIAAAAPVDAGRLADESLDPKSLST